LKKASDAVSKAGSDS